MSSVERPASLPLSWLDCLAGKGISSYRERMSSLRSRRLGPLSGVLLAVPALSVALAAVPAAAAPAVLPALPATGTSGCTGASHATLPDVPWAQQLLYPQRVWPLSTGTGVTVAVVDSGATPVPALAGHLAQGIDAGGGGTTGDCLGHGTFVASLIAAQPTAGTAFEGIAPGATVLPVRDTDDAGTSSTAWVAAGITDAVRHGASVIDVSTVVTKGGPELRAAVAAAAAHDALVVTPAVADSTTAAGRDPAANALAAEPGVLPVAGITIKGTDTVTAPAADLRAPGQSVVGVGPGGGQFVGTGGGVAAGFVAATAALVRSRYPDLTAGQLADRLVRTATPRAGVADAAGVAGGVVDPYAAVTTALPGTTRSQAHQARPFRLPPVQSGGGGVAGWAVLGVVVAVVLATAGVAATLSRGRRRRWRPAGH